MLLLCSEASTAAMHGNGQGSTQRLSHTSGVRQAVMRLLMLMHSGTARPLGPALLLKPCGRGTRGRPAGMENAPGLAGTPACMHPHEAGGTNGTSALCQSAQVP